MRSFRRGRLVLLRPGRLLLVIGFVLLMLPAGASRSPSGLRWLGVGLLTIAAVDLVGAVWATFGVRLSMSAPSDAVVGSPVITRLTVTGRSRQRLSVTMSSLKAAPWVVIEPPAEGVYTIVPEHRGEFVHAEMSLYGQGPLGLSGYARPVVLPLVTPIVVSPRPVPVPAIGPPRGHAPDRASPVTDPAAPRGVRPYAAGDSARHIHWPATARVGALVVREHERVAPADVTIVVNLGTIDDAEAERLAGQAVWIAEDALRQGRSVTLATHEEGRAVTASVAEGRAVRRRMARAVVGPVIDPELFEGPVVLVDRGAGWPTDVPSRAGRTTNGRAQ